MKIKYDYSFHRYETCTNEKKKLKSVRKNQTINNRKYSNIKTLKCVGNLNATIERI